MCVYVCSTYGEALYAVKVLQANSLLACWPFLALLALVTKAVNVGPFLQINVTVKTYGEKIIISTSDG